MDSCLTGGYSVIRVVPLKNGNEKPARGPKTLGGRRTYSVSY